MKHQNHKNHSVTYPEHKVFFIFISLFLLSSLLSISSFAESFENCLNRAKQQQHVLDQNEKIEMCFKYNAKYLNNLYCFNKVKQITVSQKSLNLKETLNSVCFYESTDFKDLNTCVQKSDVFQIADNHDEAIFNCYQNFRFSLNKKQCLEMSKKMKQPEKKIHLFNQCQEHE